MFSPARAAISLTYDDGMSQHLDHAIPDLEAFGVRGTFYVPTDGGDDSPWHTRATEWAALARRGHEIGNHTRVHPCRGWAGHNLSEYTLESICDELTVAQADVDQRVGNMPRSFAYPCCHTTVGPDSNPMSYVDFTETLFPASRVGGDQLADPATVDLRLVPSFIMHEKLPLSQIIALLDQAIAEQKWLVLTFHGIGGGHINYGRVEHQTLCKAIADRSHDLLCSTFVEIAMRIRSATGRAWTKRPRG
jgi:peptidoglycan/xylan/chitin deacetylase (PgdA/CDA1 family)